MQCVFVPLTIRLKYEYVIMFRIFSELYAKIAIRQGERRSGAGVRRSVAGSGSLGRVSGVTWNVLPSTWPSLANNVTDDSDWQSMTMNAEPAQSPLTSPHEVHSALCCAADATFNGTYCSVYFPQNRAVLAEPVSINPLQGLPLLSPAGLRTWRI